MNVERTHSVFEGLETDGKILTVPLASSVYIHSFIFSQHNPTLQEDLFVGINKMRPTWLMDDQMKQEVFEASIPAITDLVLQDDRIQKPVPEGQIEEAVAEQLSLMQKNFTGIKEAKGIGEPLQIAQLMILEDLKSYYRFRESSDNVESKYVSNFCTYVLEQQATGLEVFDALFRAVKRSFDVLDRNEGPYIKVYKYLRLIKDVAEAHVKENPEKREFYEKMGLI